MLTHLSITNLALIQNIEISLFNRFSVFTGETGAGKSVLMGAIGLLLGNRAMSEHIRSGEERAEVCGIFRFDTIPLALIPLLEELAIEIPDNELIIRRIISNNSAQNRVIINGSTCPLTTLKQLGDHLIDLHGQHDHQALLHEDAPYEIIDSLKEVSATKKAYLAAWHTYAEAKGLLKEREKAIAQLKEKQEFLQFQYDEIVTLELQPQEEEQLHEEYLLLNSVTERATLAGRAHGLISGGDDEAGVVQSLVQLRDTLKTLAKLDTQFSVWLTELEPVSHTLNDLANTVGRYGAHILEEANPLRLDEIHLRLAKIQRLKKKYDVDFEGLRQKGVQLSEELAILQGDSDLVDLRKDAVAKAHEILRIGDLLSQARQKACKEFDAKITHEMSFLGFHGGGFATLLKPLKKPTIHGKEELQFAVRTNKGEPFLGLAKTASGGEISRLMLAIKSSLAENDPVPILVFDEIDTGIGGTRAADIAAAMQKLASHHQIFVISHLHQIASVADHHYAVAKHEEGGRTITTIELLSHDERISEIARMLGGENETTRQHALSLLQRSTTTAL